MGILLNRNSGAWSSLDFFRLLNKWPRDHDMADSLDWIETRVLDKASYTILLT